MFSASQAGNLWLTSLSVVLALSGENCGSYLLSSQLPHFHVGLICLVSDYGASIWIFLAEH